MKLNLGSGDKYLKGYVNMDINNFNLLDICQDITKPPYPFRKNTFKYINCTMVFEHIPNPSEIINECHRILKKGGIMYIRTVHFTSGEAFAGDIHTTNYNNNYWDSWQRRHNNWGYKQKVLFSNVNARITFGKGFQLWNYLIEPLVNINNATRSIYEHTFLRCLFPAEEWKVKLLK